MAPSYTKYGPDYIFDRWMHTSRLRELCPICLSVRPGRSDTNGCDEGQEIMTQ